MVLESEINFCAPCGSCCVNTEFPRLFGTREVAILTPPGTNVVRVDSERALNDAYTSAAPSVDTTVYLFEGGGYPQAKIRGRCPQLSDDNSCKVIKDPNRPELCARRQRGDRGCTKARRADGLPPVTLPTPKRRPGLF